MRHGLARGIRHRLHLGGSGLGLKAKPRPQAQRLRPPAGFRQPGAQNLGGIDDGDALMAADREQMLTIARDDEMDADGQGRSKHLIIVGVTAHHARHVDGFHQLSWPPE